MQNKNGPKRGRFGVSWDPLTFTGPQVSSLRRLLAWRLTQETAGCVCQGGEFTSKKKNLFYYVQPREGFLAFHKFPRPASPLPSLGDRASLKEAARRK